MTRKDYVLIAKALRTAGSLDEGYVWNETSHKAHKGTCETLADALQADNPRFDRARFLGACGVTR